MNRAQRRAAAKTPCVLCGRPLAGDLHSVLGATWVTHGSCWRDYEARSVGRPDLARLTLEERRDALRKGLTASAKRLYAGHARRARRN